jgi:hypothetical protein
MLQFLCYALGLPFYRYAIVFRWRAWKNRVNGDEVRWVKTLPLLGTGKTDYKALRAQLTAEGH